MGKSGVVRRVKYIFGASITATLLLFLVSSSITTADAVSQELKVVDGRERLRIQTTVTEFKFSAEGICNEDTPKNVLCVDISGRGTTGANTISASGVFTTYFKKPNEMGKNIVLSRGLWSGAMLLSASNTDMSFKATTSSGKVVFVQLNEGTEENTGDVCIYGSLIITQSSEEAICVSDSVVVIGTIDAVKPQVISTAVTSFSFVGFNLCNEDLQSNGLCLDIWGGGKTTAANTMNALGNYVTHPPDSVRVNSRGSWFASQLLAVTENMMEFKAISSAGSLYIQLTEGNFDDTGIVCAYGTPLGVQAGNAICVEDSFVVIG